MYSFPNLTTFMVALRVARRGGIVRPPVLDSRRGPSKVYTRVTPEVRRRALALCRAGCHTNHEMAQRLNVAEKTINLLKREFGLTQPRREKR